MRRSDFLPPVSRARCLAFRYRSASPVRSAGAREDIPRGLEWISATPAPWCCPVGDGRISQVPGEPLADVPRSTTPVEPRRPRDGGRRGAAFRHCDGVGLHEMPDFGARSRGPQAPCVRFTPSVTRRRATLGTSWLLTFAGRAHLPPGSSRSFGCLSPPPRPSLAWRTTVRAIGRAGTRS